MLALLKCHQTVTSHAEDCGIGRQSERGGMARINASIAWWHHRPLEQISKRATIVVRSPPVGAVIQAPGLFEIIDEPQQNVVRAVVGSNLDVIGTAHIGLEAGAQRSEIAILSGEAKAR
jgi:hypothetical protein